MTAIKLTKMTITKLKKYRQNLSIVTIDGIEWIKSYDTFVARINPDHVEQYDWSHITDATATTQKHINYVAAEYGLPILKHAFIKAEQSWN